MTTGVYAGAPLLFEGGVLSPLASDLRREGLAGGGHGVIIGFLTRTCEFWRSSAASKRQPCGKCCPKCPEAKQPGGAE